ncbi:MAG: gamma-glutamyltransferase family protein [Armatimonadetes bacterium]|nr:gamma-glutamyltransferase family protein [Armatimonadota bacterium]
MASEVGVSEPGHLAHRRSTEGFYLTGPVPTSLRPPIRGSRAVVSAGHYLAALAGDRIFARGGNAVDAGVAAAMAINVVQPDLTNFGGVAPIAVYEASTGQTWQISGLGCFPRRATLEFFMEHCDGDLPAGVLASVVPAALDAYITALDRFGTMTFGDVIAPALELAEHGFPVYPALRANLATSQPKMAQFPTTRAIFFPNGDPPEVGDLLVQRDLAGLFHALIAAETGAGGDRRAGLMAARDLFYRGEIAERIARFVWEQGGLLELGDLAAFHVDVEPTVTIRFRGLDVHTCGPWCQGPVLAQMLAILETMDLGSAGTAATLHTIAEAMKLAFADREAYYGDPKFVEVPLGELLSPDYARRQAERIDARRALLEIPPGGLGRRWQARPTPAVRGGAPSDLDTSYACAVDAAGNGFSCTPSDGAGNTPIVSGLGIIVSSRGIQGWLDPHHPGCVAPGRRPRLTPSPALATRNGRLVMAFGTPGGDVQPQAMLQAFLNAVVFGMDPQQAIEFPRIATYSFPSSFFPHRSHPGSLFAEERVSEPVLSDLRDRGHRLEVWPGYHPQAGAVCMIARDEKQGTLTGGADPRRNAYAIGW